MTTLESAIASYSTATDLLAEARRNLGDAIMAAQRRDASALAPVAPESRIPPSVGTLRFCVDCGAELMASYRHCPTCGRTIRQGDSNAKDRLAAIKAEDKATEDARQGERRLAEQRQRQADNDVAKANAQAAPAIHGVPDKAAMLNSMGDVRMWIDGTRWYLSGNFDPVGAPTGWTNKTTPTGETFRAGTYTATRSKLGGFAQAGETGVKVSLRIVTAK